MLLVLYMIQTYDAWKLKHKKLLINLGVRWGGWSRPGPTPLPPGNGPGTHFTVGWAPRPVCTGAETSTSTGNGSPDLPPRSESDVKMTTL